jgi:hypothetical protein
LKGNYPTNYTVVSDRPADQIWDDLINYCAGNGIKIKVLDRKSGLIVSEWYKVAPFTFEDKNGNPEIANAKVIIGCDSKGPFKFNCQIPNIAWAYINFKLKEENNKTSVTVRLSDLVAWYNQNDYSKNIRSTGVMEKEIIDRIK